MDQEQVENSENWLDQPNGTGPFKLATYDIGELIVLERNENYHLGPPHIDERPDDPERRVGDDHVRERRDSPHRRGP